MYLYEVKNVLCGQAIEIGVSRALIQTTWSHRLPSPESAPIRYYRRYQYGVLVQLYSVLRICSAMITIIALT